MSLFGKLCNLYETTGQGTQSGTEFVYTTPWANKTLIGTVNICIPIISSSNLSSIYNYYWCDKNGLPVPDTATRLDNITNQWQLSGVLMSDRISATEFFNNVGAMFPLKNIVNSPYTPRKYYILENPENNTACLFSTYDGDIQSSMRFFNTTTLRGSYIQKNTIPTLNPYLRDNTYNAIIGNFVFFYNNTFYSISFNAGSAPNEYSSRFTSSVTTTSLNDGDLAGFFSNFDNNYTPTYPPTDPYNGAGDSTTDGGDGTFDGSSDPVPVPSLPSVGATDTGFITLFVPTRAQLKQVAEYMWGGLFDVSTWKRLFEDPMDCILGLSVIPVTVPATASGNITVGNIELSGISLPIADQQYVEVDCGTIDFTHRFFGSYLDFEPYTKMSLFVPYSGVHSVSADDIIGKVVGLKYHIDILTGSLVAFLTCGDSVLYEFNGACASNIPVNSMNYASTIENAIRIAVNIGTTVATAGASAPVQGISQAQQTARNIGTGISLAGSTTEGALSLKPNIDRAGSLGGTTGLMGHQIPYFIITRPRLCKPKNQDFFQGYPSFIQTSVGDLIGKGFTSFTNIIIAESFMTDAENEELETILQGGVYL